MPQPGPAVAMAAEEGRFAAGMDHYEVLGVARTAPAAEIRRHYHRLSLQLHPDKQAQSGRSSSSNSSSSHTATVAADFQRLGEAWETLRDDRARQLYDSQLTHATVWQEFPVDETVDLDDMDLDDEAGVYSWPCRCSGEFAVTEDELLDGCDVVSCSSCTLSIRVLFEAVSGPPG